MDKPEKKLNPKEVSFCQHYVTGDTGIRGNAAASYQAAGFAAARGQATYNGSSRLLQRPEIREYIYQLQLQASKEAISKLKGWQEIAADAQQQLISISHGWFTSKYPVMGKEHSEPIMIQDRETAAAANVVLRATLEIIERAFPKNVQPPKDDREIIEQTLGRRAPEQQNRLYQ